MLVKNWMSKKVITIDGDDSMQAAIHLLKTHKIRLLPVMKKDKLVGIVSDGDIKRASASDATTLDVYELAYLISKIKIKNIMTKKVITVPDDYTVAETAETLLENKIPGVPVVDTKGAVVGVITQSDLFRVMISITGVKNRGIQFAFQQENRPGAIKELADIIRKYNGRMVSLLTSYEDVPEGQRNIYIHAHAIERDKIPQIKKELGEKAKLLYLVDHRENKREIYQ
ncbi:CBS and ACT domain-containing protein [Thermodesulfobacteriota bacterium]